MKGVLGLCRGERSFVLRACVTQVWYVVCSLGGIFGPGVRYRLKRLSAHVSEQLRRSVAFLAEVFSFYCICDMSFLQVDVSKVDRRTFM